MAAGSSARVREAQSDGVQFGGTFYDRRRLDDELPVMRRKMKE